MDRRDIMDLIDILDLMDIMYLIDIMDLIDFMEINLPGQFWLNSLFFEAPCLLIAIARYHQNGNTSREGEIYHSHTRVPTRQNEPNENRPDERWV